MLSAVEIFLVGRLNYAGQLNRIEGLLYSVKIREGIKITQKRQKKESPKILNLSERLSPHLKTAILAPVLFNNRLLSTVRLLNYRQAFGSLALFSFSLLHGLEGPLLLLCLLQFLVNVDVGGGADDAATLYPVAGVGYEVVRVVLTELVRAGLQW